VAHAAVTRKSVRILEVGEALIPPEVEVATPASFGVFLRSALKSMGIRTDRIIVDVPRQDAVLNPLTLPPTPEVELPNMVRFQVAKELPFSIEQGVVDFAVEGKNAEKAGNIDLIVAAVRNHVMDYYKAVAAEAGLVLEHIGLRPYANMVSVAELGTHQKGRVVLVDVGPSMTEINVLRDGRLAFSRAAAVTVENGNKSVPGAGPQAAGDESIIAFRDNTERASSAVDELLVEVTRTIEAYRATDPGATIDRVIVAGACGIEKEFAEALGRRFRAATSIYRPPEPLVRELERRVKVNWSGFGAVLGLAWGQVRPTVSHFDFLHPKEPIDTRREKLRKVPVVAAAVVAMLLFVGGVYGWKIYSRARQIKALDSQLATAKKEMDDLNRFYAMVADADAWRKESVVWLDKMYTIAETLPPNKDAYLKELSFNDKGEIMMRFVATSDKVLADLVDRLMKLEVKGKPLFEVDPKRSVVRKSPKDAPYETQQDIPMQLLSALPEPKAKGR